MLDEAGREALLRALPRPLPRYMPNTVGTLQELRKQLQAVREQGWAIDDEENEAGICCFGAPVFCHAGVPVAAISVSVLRFRRKDDVRKAYVEPLLQACRTISQRIAETPALSGAEAL